MEERKDAERFASAIQGGFRVVEAKVETAPDGKAQVLITLESLTRQEVWQVATPKLVSED